MLTLQPEPTHYNVTGLPFSLLPRTSAEQGLLQGLHCLCGRLSCRIDAYAWRCPHCGFTRPCPSISSLKPVKTLSSCMEDTVIHRGANIDVRIQRRRDGSTETTSFTFPQHLGGGTVYHIQSIGSDADGDREVDEIYYALQKDSLSDEDKSLQIGIYKDIIPFRRHPLLNKTVKGDLVSQQFTCNYGAQYKHAVRMNTTQLEDAPDSVKRALKFIIECTQEALMGSDFEDSCNFNEIYPVLYLETQKMNFHDDGEPGVGPVISSLSLGAETRMAFRLKAKHLELYSKTIQSRSLEKRLAPPTEQKDQRAACHAIAWTDRILLSFPLRHGCIVVQSGARLQDMLEHAVQPIMNEAGRGRRGGNAVRIAITARQIDASDFGVKSKKHRSKFSVSKGESCQ